MSCQPEHFTVSDPEMLKLRCFRMIMLDMDLSMLARRLPLVQAMFFPGFFGILIRPLRPDWL